MADAFGKSGVTSIQLELERERAIYLLLVARLLNGSHAAAAHFNIKSALALIREINYCFNYLPEDTFARPRASAPFAGRARGVCGRASSGFYGCAAKYKLIRNANLRLCQV